MNEICKKFSNLLAVDSISEVGKGGDDFVLVFGDLVGVGDDTLSKGLVSGFVPIEC